MFWEFFERPNDQCVSSIKRAYFSHNERLELKAHWDEISSLLKEIADNQDVPNGMCMINWRILFGNIRRIICELRRADWSQPYNLNCYVRLSMTKVYVGCIN